MEQKKEGIVKKPRGRKNWEKERKRDPVADTEAGVYHPG